jgi:DNA helicase-2/ATP-dependent DNA helicase PcrA
MTEKIETAADRDVWKCLDAHQSFALIAGAGSGKTESLVDALGRIREREGQQLRRNGQRVACITFTKRAVKVVETRLGFDELYLVSTLHSFLWGQIGRFQSDIREAIRLDRLPKLIAKEREKDNGGKSRDALDARAKAERYEQDLAAIDTVEHFEYRDAKVGNYQEGQLSHDDVIEIAAYLFQKNSTFRRITGLRFPYIFVDEAQDTFEGIVMGLNLVCAGEGLPIVGYFGDPWQQIYDTSVGTFGPPANGKKISKTENFRCSESVIRLLNAFRDDVKQYAAGENKGREGSVVFRLVRAETPEMPRSRYSEEQITRALTQMDVALTDWGWSDRDDIIRLFLARQMIARRMGFAELNRLFTGTYASTRAEDAFGRGEHFLLKPLTATVYPLIAAHQAGDSRRIIDVLRRDSPAFAVDGPNASKTLKNMIDTSLSLVGQLNTLWKSHTIGDMLRFCVGKQLIQASEGLKEHLGREPRTETYDEAIHIVEKGDWLADAFFAMDMSEIPPYASFISNNTAYSTQHGVKGEQYSKVLVVYDDIEARWNDYSFGKVLTPTTIGQPTERQLARTRKLAYVSFSRALEDLRVLLFTSKPEAAKDELIARGLLRPEQIEIVS